MRRVLHVVEAFGGGVQTAMQAYLEFTPEYEHVVVANVRDDTATKLPPRVRVIAARKSLFSQYRTAARTIREFQPDVIHAHSSWAGFYGRILGRRFRVPVVYSPHAFAFLRTDQSKLMRKAYLGVERRLARYTTSYLAYSTYEASLAKEFGSGAACHIVHSAISPSTAMELSDSAADEDASTYDIALLGRIAPQKGPEFFLETLTALRAAGWNGSIKWIGNGPKDDVKMLEQAGVEVTGWLSRTEALQALAGSRLLYHCGAWEAGVPYAVLEGAALGLPVVMRSLPCSTDMEGTSLGATPAECAELIVSLLSDPVKYAEAQERVRLLVSDEWAVLQRDGLVAAYEGAAASRQDMEPPLLGELQWN